MNRLSPRLVALKLLRGAKITLLAAAVGLVALDHWAAAQTAAGGDGGSTGTGASNSGSSGGASAGADDAGESSPDELGAAGVDAPSADGLDGNATADSEDRLKAKDRAHLGVTLRDRAGVIRVTEVGPDTPAARVGLKTGDVILAVNRQGVMKSQDVIALIAQMKPSAPVDLRVLRDGEVINVRTRLGSQADALASREEAGDAERTTVMRPETSDESLPDPESESRAESASMEDAPADFADQIEQIQRELREFRGALDSLRQEVRDLRSSR